MKKISTRFALLMAVAAVVPLLAYGAVSILSLQKGAKQQVIQGNQNIAQRVAEQIELYVSNSARTLQTVGAQLQHTGLLLWQQERILKNFALKFPVFTELTLTDENGIPIVTSRIGRGTVTVPVSGSPRNGVLMSNFTLDGDRLPTTVLAISIGEAGHRGWLVAQVSLEELWRMVDRIRVGDHGYALLVTGEGRLIAHGEPQLKTVVARSKETGTHPLIPANGEEPLAVVASSGTSLEYEDWAKDRIGGTRGTILGVKAQVPSLDWTVVVEQPTEEAYKIQRELQLQLVIAITVALFVMLVVGYFFGRSFINPILNLTRGTRALAEGHLEERVAVTSKDELGQLGNAFNNMADKLVELQDDVRKKERQAMFGRVSIGLVHDLSTPIQNIGNVCKMIVMLFDDLEYRETFKRTVDRELALIKRMLEDLRNVAKPVPLDKMPLDLNRAITEVAESMKGSAETSGLALETAPCFGPLYIEGDRYALNRVFGNLLKNAFQATTPKGQVLVRTIRQGDHAVVEVVDTGSGIPPERLATIFDDFVTTKKRGLGLGLAISKKMVEQMAGTISVTSEVGRGTTFTLRFPLTKARPEQLAVS